MAANNNNNKRKVTPPPKNPKGGNAGKYYTHVAPKFELIESWCRDGYLDKDIAVMLGLGQSTFKRYKKEHKDLRDLLTKTKEVVDAKVENKLFTRAMGYTYDEITYEYGTEVKRVTKTVHPDTTAQIFWLKNRRPDKWRDKRNYEHQGEVTTNVNSVSELSTDQLKDIVAKLGVEDGES